MLYCIFAVQFESCFLYLVQLPRYTSYSIRVKSSPSTYSVFLRASVLNFTFRTLSINMDSVMTSTSIFSAVWRGASLWFGLILNKCPYFKSRKLRKNPDFQFLCKKCQELWASVPTGQQLEPRNGRPPSMGMHSAPCAHRTCFMNHTTCLAIWVCCICSAQTLFKDFLTHFIELSHKCNFPMRQNDRCFSLIGKMLFFDLFLIFMQNFAELYSSTGVLLQLLPPWEYNENCIFEMFCKMSWKITNSGSDSNIPT